MAVRTDLTISHTDVILEHQFGFRGKHATVEQAHEIFSIIRAALEAEHNCPAVFLDVSQTFDRVWIDGLLHKISEYLPAQHVEIIQSYYPPVASR